MRPLGLAPQLFDAAPGPHERGGASGGRRSEPPGPRACTGTSTWSRPIADDWSVDPFGGEIRDGLLWGRGAVDMKDMDAMILTALGDILEPGERPARDLVVAFFADEENGGVYGSH